MIDDISLLYCLQTDAVYLRHRFFVFSVSQIVMPPYLEKVRDRLAENIHELWAMNKIELGWSYGKVGDLFDTDGENRVTEH